MKGGDIVTLNNISLSDSQIMELKEEFKIKDETILKKDVSISIKINKQFVIDTSVNLKQANDRGLKQKIKDHLDFGNDVMDTDKLIKYSILRDAILIHSFGYRVFINRCMGVSKSGGFSNKENIKKFKDLQPIVEKSVKKIPPEIVRKYEREIKSSGINKELLIHISTLFGTQLQPDNSDFKKKLKSKFVGNTFFQKSPKKVFINLFDIVYSKMEDSINEKYEIIDEFNKLEANLDEKAVQSVWDTGFRKRKGGDPEDENRMTEYRESKFTLRRILKLIGIMILMIYFIFLLLESYRLLCFQIDRIIQARETYLGIFPPEEDENTEQDKNFISYIFTFFKIMHEAIAGKFIQMIQSMQNDNSLVYERLKDIVYSSASSASNEAFESCSDDYFGCINGFLTGLTRDQALDNMKQDIQDQLEIEYITRRNNFKKMLKNSHYEYNSAFTNIITGINGLLFSNVLLLNTFFPKTYTKTFVFASFSLLQSSYMSRDILWRLGFTGSHIVHLLTNPTQYIKDSPTEEPPQHPAITNEVISHTLQDQRNEEEETNFNSNNYNPEQIDEFIHEFFSEGKLGGNKKIRKRKYTRKMNKTKKKLRRKTKSKK